MDPLSDRRRAGPGGPIRRAPGAESSEMAKALKRMSMLATRAQAAVLVATFLTPTANAEQTGFSSRQPIVGGQPVSIAEHPWVVYLVDTQGNQYCGGTLAKENKVVTAAHCVHSETPESLQVVAGRE